MIRLSARRVFCIVFATIDSSLFSMPQSVSISLWKRFDWIAVSLLYNCGIPLAKKGAKFVTRFCKKRIMCLSCHSIRLRMPILFNWTDLNHSGMGVHWVPAARDNYDAFLNTSIYASEKRAHNVRLTACWLLVFINREINLNWISRGLLFFGFGNFAVFVLSQNTPSYT